MQVVAVLSEKGGVGKTTTCMSLAGVTAEASRTLVVDVDPQASASWWSANIDDEQRPFDFATATDVTQLGGLRDKAEAEGYDVVFVDTPGSLEGRAILKTVLASSDYAVIPTEPAPLSVEPLIRTVRTLIAPSGIPYRVLCNKIDGRAAGMRDDAFRMLDEQGIRRFRASTRLLSAHAYAPAQGLVVTQYPKDRYSIEAASEYRAVALEMFADWRTPIGRHTQLAVSARNPGGQ
jgi:chromosome partitioning protein